MPAPTPPSTETDADATTTGTTGPLRQDTSPPEAGTDAAREGAGAPDDAAEHATPAESTAEPTTPADEAAGPRLRAAEQPTDEQPASTGEDATAAVSDAPAPDTTQATGEAPAATPEQRAPQAPDRGDTRGEKGKKSEGKRQQKPSVTPAEVVRIVGSSSERALAYVGKPDPRLSRLSRKVREHLITEIPPVTAGALLGVAALARHFVASAATGRYRDLFFLWELFRLHPQICKPVLAERQEALAKARASLETATRLGVRGRTSLLEQDIARAEGLIWQWLRSALVDELPAVGARPALASALLAREPGLEVPLPSAPDDRWLSEAAAAADGGELAPAIEKVFGAHLDRLPGTVATLSLAHERFPEQVEALVDRVDLESPEIGAVLAWARDHGQAERLRNRIAARVDQEVEKGPQDALALWWSWRERGVELPLPPALRATSIDDLDLTRPETAQLAAILVDEGTLIDVQSKLTALATANRQLAEKAYEAFVCAGHDVHLPPALRDNKMVKEGTRCPWCEAWTWVRPGHERRCPRAASGTAPPPPPTPELADDWSVGTAATASSTPSGGTAVLGEPEPEGRQPVAPSTTREAGGTSEADRPATPEP